MVRAEVIVAMGSRDASVGSHQSGPEYAATGLLVRAVGVGDFCPIVISL